MRNLKIIITYFFQIFFSNKMSKVSDQVAFEPLKTISGFEIETEFPHRIRNIETKEEVPFKKTANGVIVRLNLKNIYIHTLVAQQFLEYKDGMIIKFLDNDSSNYDVWNLDIQEQIKPTTSEPENDESTSNAGKLINLEDNFLFDNISRKNYVFDGILNENLALKDLQRTMIFTYEPFIFYLKTLGNSEIKLEPRTEKDAVRILKNIVIGEKFIEIPSGKNGVKIIKVPVSLKYLFDEGLGVNQNKNKFLVRAVKFLSDDPNEFSLFRGYPFKRLKNPDISIIQKFIDHMRDNICDDNKDVFEYMKKWIAFIVQNPGKKTTVAPIIIGDQGTGKGDFFSVPIATLFGKYALKNTTKIDSITGKFNTIIENKVIGMCNEMQDESNAKFLNGDALKSIITEYPIEYESKFVNKREGENVINLIFYSNHELPIRLENGDRRYLVIKVSNKRKEDFEYFGKLAKTMEHKLFYQTLFTWFLDVDLKDFNPRDIPKTEAKQDMIHASKESWQLFFEDYIDYFKGDGWIASSCYSEYQEYCKQYGFAAYSLTKFGIRIKRYVDIKQRKRNGQSNRYYVFNDTGTKEHNKYLEKLKEMPEDNSVAIEPPKKKKMPKMNDPKEDDYF